MSGRPEFARKDMRKRHDLLTSLGYRLTAAKGHLRYEHNTQPPLILPGTPVRHGRHMDRLMRLLRARHPDHPSLRLPGKRRKRLHTAPAANAAKPILEIAPPAPKPVVLDYTGCWDCGYRWLSDLDPTGRRCPRCPGAIQVGAVRQIRPRPAPQPWIPVKRSEAA